MVLRISQVLCAITITVSLSISGCALFERTSEAERKPLLLQQPIEKLVISRSGRFVFKAARTASQPTDLGAQGQFEWVELRDGPYKARQLLLFLNPLGQSGPSLERQLSFESAGGAAGTAGWKPDTVRIFDEQGNPVARGDQRSLLVKLIGPQITGYISDTQVDALLASVMNLLQSTAGVQDLHHQRIYSSDALELSIRIVYDAPPMFSDGAGTASR